MAETSRRHVSLRLCESAWSIDGSRRRTWAATWPISGCRSDFPRLCSRRHEDARMIGVKVMISNGTDTDDYRNRAQDVIARLQHMFLYQMKAELYLTEWDYRRDPSMVVKAGEIATRVSQWLTRQRPYLPFWGPTVPRITSQEIRRACERIRNGEAVQCGRSLIRPKRRSPTRGFSLDLRRTSAGRSYGAATTMRSNSRHRSSQHLCRI